MISILFVISSTSYISVMKGNHICHVHMIIKNENEEKEERLKCKKGREKIKKGEK